jgi:hypothetical protein
VPPPWRLIVQSELMESEIDETLHSSNEGVPAVIPKDLFDSRFPTLLGTSGVICALLGLLSWHAYGAFAMRGITATISHDGSAAHRAALFADGFRLIQMLLGLSAIFLGGISLGKAKAKGRPVTLLGHASLWAGIAVLVLSFVLV